MGISIADTDLLTIGEIFDMMTEAGNDKAEYAYVATQDDMANF